MPVFSPYAKLLDELPISEHVVTVLGSETHYWVYGPDDAPLTIVVAHGYRGEHHGLEPVIAQFRGVRFIGADMPGFGESSELDAGHSIDSYAHWLADFMQQLDVTMMGRRSLMALMPSSSSRSVPNCQSSSVLILDALSPPKKILQIWIYFSNFSPIPPHL
jgi:hypothetical protein